MSDTVTPNAILENDNQASERSSVTTLQDIRTILISLHYLFSDQGDPLHPNRLGSLIISIPNNSVNRDPRVIQEIVRLATRMAYSNITHGLSLHRGVDKQVFDSFPMVTCPPDSCSCPICFECFDAVEPPVVVDDSDDRGNDFIESVMKRRKLSPEPSSEESGYSTPIDLATHIATTEVVPPVMTEPEYPVPPVSRGDEMDYDSEPGKIESKEYDHVAVEMPCKHVFGRNCLHEWLKNNSTCPLCRQPVPRGNPSSTAPNTSPESSRPMGHPEIFDAFVNRNAGSDIRYFTVPTPSSVPSNHEPSFGEMGQNFWTRSDSESNPTSLDETLSFVSLARAHLLRFLRSPENQAGTPDLYPPNLHREGEGEAGQQANEETGQEAQEDTPLQMPAEISLQAHDETDRVLHNDNSPAQNERGDSSLDRRHEEFEEQDHIHQSGSNLTGINQEHPSNDPEDGNSGNI